jgi:hypothetical protein
LILARSNEFRIRLPVQNSNTILAVVHSITVHEYVALGQAECLLTQRSVGLLYNIVLKLHYL